MSYLLHPMFNSLSTRKRKKTKKTKEFLVAERKHNKYIKSMGLDKRTTPPPKSYGLTNDLRVQDNKPYIQWVRRVTRKKDLQQLRPILLQLLTTKAHIWSYQRKR